MLEHVVQPGECIISIADFYGLFWKRLWNLSENADLKSRRKNASLLFPGDVLVIPDKEKQQLERSTDQRHHFIVRGRPVHLRVRLLAAGKPIADEPYLLEVNDERINGATDGDGLLEELIPPSTTEALLHLQKSKVNLQLLIGHVGPIEEIAGVQARLNNLGYHCGDEDGIMNPLTTSALQAFQETKKLPVTGEPDQTTRDEIRKMYGC
jgi:hypothetical protein